MGCDRWRDVEWDVWSASDRGECEEEGMTATVVAVDAPASMRDSSSNRW